MTRASVLAGLALGAVAMVTGLPDEIPPSWLGRPMVAFLLPAAVAVMDVLLRAVSRRPVDPQAGDSGLATAEAIMARVSVFVVGIHAAVLAGLVGWVPAGDWTMRVVPLMLGLVMISVGNLLPRTRPNLAIGVRTRRTLADRAAWIALHRSAGYVVVASGVVVAVSALALPRPIGPRMIQLVGPLAAIGLWLLARQQGRAAVA
jgi:uncharacterized membrane protein